MKRNNQVISTKNGEITKMSKTDYWTETEKALKKEANEKGTTGFDKINGNLEQFYKDKAAHSKQMQAIKEQLLEILHNFEEFKWDADIEKVFADAEVKE